jgi:hypothetical protein
LDFHRRRARNRAGHSGWRGTGLKWKQVRLTDRLGSALGSWTARSGARDRAGNFGRKELGSELENWDFKQEPGGAQHGTGGHPLGEELENRLGIPDGEELGSEPQAWNWDFRQNQRWAQHLDFH